MISTDTNTPAIDEIKTTALLSSSTGLQRPIPNHPASISHFGGQSTSETTAQMGSLLGLIHKKLEGFKAPENAEEVKRLMFDSKTKSKTLKAMRTKNIVRPLAYNRNQIYHGKIIELQGLADARRLAAMIGYMVGEKSPTPCDFCLNGGSNFEDCVVVPGYFNGSCIDCAFTSQGYQRTCNCRPPEPTRATINAQGSLNQINREEIKEVVREVVREIVREVVREVVSDSMGETHQGVGARASRGIIEDIVREVLEEDIREATEDVKEQAGEDIEEDTIEKAE